jgi:hypothetical protein
VITFGSTGDGMLLVSCQEHSSSALVLGCGVELKKHLAEENREICTLLYLKRKKTHMLQKELIYVQTYTN